MKKLILASLLVTASSVAFASSTVVIVWGGLPPTSGSGTTPSQTATADGEVPATIAGISDQSLVCDDFNQQTNVSSGTVFDYSVETLANLSGAYFTSGFVTGLGSTLTQAQAYDIAAVLVTELEALGTETGSNAQAVADYNYALWDLMEPGASDNNGDAIFDGKNTTNATVLDSAAAGYLQSAYNAVTASTPATATINDEKALVIYTPTSGANSSIGTQEFLGLNTPVGTPEPSTWFLMAALGLSLCVPQVRSRLSVALSRN